VGAPAHRRLAYEAAAQSLVLLRNDGVLPLKHGASPPKVALIGPMTNATWMYERYGYHPEPRSPLYHTLHDALSERLGAERVSNTPGCSDAEKTTTCICEAIDAAAVKNAVDDADVLVYLVGTGEPIESEVVNHGVGGPR
jgi:hypothetical protein